MFFKNTINHSNVNSCLKCAHFFTKPCSFFSENDIIDIDIQKSTKYIPVWSSFTRNHLAPSTSLIFTVWVMIILMELEMNILWNLQIYGVVFTPVKLIFFCFSFIFKFQLLEHSENLLSYIDKVIPLFGWCCAWE